jgi:hypothetical protein
VAQLLREATGEGRLTTDELEERLEAVYAARTYGQLDSLVADLPVARPVTRPPARARTRVPLWLGAAGAATLLLAIVGALAGAVRHSAQVLASPVPPPGSPTPAGAPTIHIGHHLLLLPPPGAFADGHPGLVVAGALIGVFTILVACTALVWFVSHARARRI